MFARIKSKARSVVIIVLVAMPIAAAVNVFGQNAELVKQTDQVSIDVSNVTISSALFVLTQQNPGLRIGFEESSRTSMEPKISLKRKAEDLSSVFDALVALDTEYRWYEYEGVFVFEPRNRFPKCFDLLNLKVSSIAMPIETRRVDLINAIIGSPEVNKFLKSNSLDYLFSFEYLMKSQLFYKEGRKSQLAENDNVIEVLNRIIRLSDSVGMWQIGFYGPERKYLSVLLT
ncbi:MAG: hypothetical protein R2684_12150 [Pyrinomonadaceae bacterium]